MMITLFPKKDFVSFLVTVFFVGAVAVAVVIGLIYSPNACKHVAFRVVVILMVNLFFFFASFLSYHFGTFYPVESMDVLVSSVKIECEHTEN